MKIEIIDNYLSKDVHNRMLESFLRPNKSIPYDVCQIVPDEHWNSKYDRKYNFQLVHSFYQSHTPHKTFQMVAPLIEKLNPFALIRVKANLNPFTNEIVEHGMHNDSEHPNAKSAVYYLNSNNGATVFEDGTRVESVANRIAIFNSNILHTGTTCTDKMFRGVVNVIYV